MARLAPSTSFLEFDANINRDLLTPQHAHFTLACILAKTYKAALPILDRFDYKIDLEKTGLKGEDVRLFFYYGGICYIAQRQYTKALQFFENVRFVSLHKVLTVQVISAPAIMPSAIMVEAYKKHLIVSLIHLGQVSTLYTSALLTLAKAPTLPRYTHGSVSRICKQICAPYEELATSFSTRSVEDLGKVADTHSEVFLKVRMQLGRAPNLQDGNMGLVGQVISALRRQNIQRLTKTYVTVPLATVAEKHNFKEVAAAEEQLLKMVQFELIH